MESQPAKSVAIPDLTDLPDATSVRPTVHRQSSVLSSSFWISWRMVITLSAFMGATMHSVMRSILSITMVCMVNATAIKHNDTSSENFGQQENCPNITVVNHEYDGEFDWSVKEQSYIFAAMAWGQVATALPAGLFADRYSARKLLFFAILIAAVLTLLTPLAANLGYGAMIAVRAALGLTGGILWPCINALIARWAPPSERSMLYGIVTAGNQISIVFLMPISAALCKEKDFFGGWPAAYYITGIISVIFTIVWLLVTADDPNEHKKISKEELSIINAGRTTTYDKEKRKRLRLPLKEIICSPATLSIVASLTSAAWGIMCLLNYLPTYLRDVLQVNLSQNGDFSALPFLSQFVFKIIFSRLADVMKKYTQCSRTVIMKGFNTFGLLSLSGFLFGATFLDCSQSGLAVALLCIAAGLYSAVTPGFLASSVLVAPRYAGFIAAWTNFIATIFSGILLPYIVGAVVVDSTAFEWRIIIGIGSLTQVISAIIFLIWGSAEEEEWAKSFHKQYDDPSDKPAVKTSEISENLLNDKQSIKQMEASFIKS